MIADTLAQLVELSRRLADPGLDYVILSEGNTSARADDETFWVKASGREMRDISEAGFVRVYFQRVLSLLDQERATDREIKTALAEAKVEPSPGHPSVETLLHAVCLRLQGVNFIGHTHPTPVNALTCSVGFEAAFGGRLFPDEIVICGPAPLLVPYTDPGVPLAREIHRRLQTHVDRYGEIPKMILLQNHGLIALGSTPQEVENITAMATKAARVRLGAYAAGGPRFLAQRDVQRIHTRPDEQYRRIVSDK